MSPLHTHSVCPLYSPPIQSAEQETASWPQWLRGLQSEPTGVGQARAEVSVPQTVSTRRRSPHDTTNIRSAVASATANQQLTLWRSPSCSPTRRGNATQRNSEQPHRRRSSEPPRARRADIYDLVIKSRTMNSIESAKFSSPTADSV